MVSPELYGNVQSQQEQGEVPHAWGCPKNDAGVTHANKPASTNIRKDRTMTQWIRSNPRGHNGGAVLLKDGELVFAIEEERLSKKKYDGGPYAL